VCALCGADIFSSSVLKTLNDAQLRTEVSYSKTGVNISLLFKDSKFEIVLAMQSICNDVARVCGL
jgi:hypothetical protein